ncbi:MAG: hypothetical protein ACRC62_38380 [Microcoleus sp.]
MTAKEQIADKIFNEFDRLGVSTNQDAYSGLMCDYQSLLKEGEPDVIVVKIYDDQADTLYDAQKVLGFVETLESASLVPDEAQNIWNLIREFEV